jgi:hypothetical protein
MTNLRPPDGRVFVKIDKIHGKQVDATILAIGNNVDVEVGQKVCVIGKLEKVEIQDAETYSVKEKNIAFVYEQD